MGLFGEKTTIALTLSGHEFVAGSSIAASVTVGEGGDDRVQALRVELGYTNLYYRRQSRSSSDGGGWEDALSTENVKVATQHVPADQLGARSDSGTFDFLLALPGGAPASVEKWVEWSVTAILDRRRSPDRRHAVPITVLAPSDIAASARQDCDPKCDMLLELPTRVARVGETLSGVLHVNPRQQFEAREVRVALEHRIHHEDNIVRRLGEEKVTLAGRTQFVPGAAQQFPFQITVPADGAPSMRAEHNEVRWHLKGVCNRRLRGDIEVLAELAVYNAPPERMG